jgi:hypothetical protein
MLDSLVRVSRRVIENHFVSIANTHMETSQQRNAVLQALIFSPREKTLRAKRTKPKKGACYQSSVQNPVYPEGYKEKVPHNGSLHLPPRFLPNSKQMLTHPALQESPTLPPDKKPRFNHTGNPPLSAPKGNIVLGKTGFQCFLLNNFKYFLTLFSKFFSSFPHGTCSLSVSRQYLALDESYHPFRVGVPTCSTLRTQVVRGELWVKNGILTLFDVLFQRTYTQVTH